MFVFFNKFKKNLIKMIKNWHNNLNIAIHQTPILDHWEILKIYESLVWDVCNATGMVFCCGCLKWAQNDDVEH